MSNKTKKKSNRNPAAKAPHKRTYFLPLLAAGAVAICAVVVFLVNRNGTLSGSNDTDNVVSIADAVISDRTQAENNSADDEVNDTNIASDGRQAENNVTDGSVGGAVTIASGESLVIPTAEITTDAAFFPVEVDGTAMEVIAVRDSVGNIRTAFNTCQVCYDSGRGYYVQYGDYLVCQNCGNRFAMDQVEIESGGCNPWPIFDENKTVAEDGISISYDFLIEAQGIFANWKGNY